MGSRPRSQAEMQLLGGTGGMSGQGAKGQGVLWVRFKKTNGSVEFILLTEVFKLRNKYIIVFLTHLSKGNWVWVFGLEEWRIQRLWLRGSVKPRGTNLGGRVRPGQPGCWCWQCPGQSGLSWVSLWSFTAPSFSSSCFLGFSSGAISRVVKKAILLSSKTKFKFGPCPWEARERGQVS